MHVVSRFVVHARRHSVSMRLVGLADRTPRRPQCLLRALRGWSTARKRSKVSPQRLKRILSDVDLAPGPHTECADQEQGRAPALHGVLKQKWQHDAGHQEPALVHGHAQDDTNESQRRGVSFQHAFHVPLPFHLRDASGNRRLAPWAAYVRTRSSVARSMSRFASSVVCWRTWPTRVRTAVSAAWSVIDCSFHGTSPAYLAPRRPRASVATNPPGVYQRAHHVPCWCRALPPRPEHQRGKLLYASHSGQRLGWRVPHTAAAPRG